MTARRPRPETPTRARPPSVAPRTDYHGIIVEGSLRERSALEMVKVLGTRKGNDWRLLRVGVTRRTLPAVVERLQKSLTSRQGVPFYAHFYRPGELIVVFPERVFRLTPEKETWAPALAYGRSVGIPIRQLDFHPCRFEDETY